ETAATVLPPDTGAQAPAETGHSGRARDGAVRVRPGLRAPGRGAHDGPGRARRWALTMAVLRRNPVARYHESGDARGCGRVESPVSAASSCTHPRWSAPGSRTSAQRPEPDGLARPNDLVRRHRPACVHRTRSEEHTSELQSRENLVCRLLLEKKNKK